MQIIDLHEDLLLHINRPELFADKDQTSWEMLKEAGVRLTVATAFPVPAHEDWHAPESNTLIEQDLDAYQDHAALHPEWTIVTTSSQLDALLEQHSRYGLLLHVEGLNSFDDTPEHWGMLDRWHSKGLRSLGIVWNKTNSLGGGTEDPEVGLTELGKKVIEWCLRHQVVVDCAHMHKKMFAEVSSLIRGAGLPLYVSHGNATALCPSSRNFDDEQLRSIAESNGTIGVFFSGAYVAPEISDNTLLSVVSHIQHIADVAGADHVSIGTDFGGVTKGVPTGLTNITCLAALRRELEQCFSAEVVEKMFARNAHRTLCAYLPYE